MGDPAKLDNVRRELTLLRGIAVRQAATESLELSSVLAELKKVNLAIWEAEDRIRDCERQGVFETAFIDVARSIYHLNDARAAAKRKLNLLTSSAIVEEKSYAPYARETTP